jgi:DNA topoisomerase-1
MESKKDIVKRLKASCAKCSQVILATDEDREGEAIAWHLLEILKPKVPVRRAVFHEISKDAVVNAFANTREVDMNIVQSQESRRILDRLTGFTLSPILWRYDHIILSIAIFS